MKIKIKHKNIIFGLILLSVFGLIQVFNFINVGERLGIVSITPDVFEWKNEKTTVFSHNVTHVSSSNEQTNSYQHDNVAITDADKNDPIITKDIAKNLFFSMKYFEPEEWWNHTGIPDSSMINLTDSSADEIFKIDLPDATKYPKKIKFNSMNFYGGEGKIILPLNTGFSSKHKTKKVQNTSVTKENSSSGKETIEGKIITPTNDSGYEQIYTFKGVMFNDGGPGLSQINLSWNEEDNYFLIKLTNSATKKAVNTIIEFRQALEFYFTTSVSVDYDVWMITDTPTYSLDSDVFTKEDEIDYHSKTQENIDNFGVVSGGKDRRTFDYQDEPFFFTKENTYQDVAVFLISQKIIVSRYGLPWNEIKITFYKDSDLLEAISMSQHLDGSEIHFSLSTIEGTEDDVHIDASSTSIDDNLNFTIPFKDKPEPEEPPTINSFEIKNQDKKEITFSFQIDDPLNLTKEVFVYDNLKEENIYQLSESEIVSGEVTINFDSKSGEQNWSLNASWENSEGKTGISESNQQTFNIKEEPNIIGWIFLIIFLLILIILLILGIILFSKKRKNKVEDNKLVLENNTYVPSSSKQTNKEEFFDENQITGIQEFSNENQSREIEQRFDED